MVLLVRQNGIYLSNNSAIQLCNEKKTQKYRSQQGPHLALMPSKPHRYLRIVLGLQDSARSSAVWELDMCLLKLTLINTPLLPLFSTLLKNYINSCCCPTELLKKAEAWWYLGALVTCVCSLSSSELQAAFHPKFSVQPSLYFSKAQRILIYYFFTLSNLFLAKLLWNFWSIQKGSLHSGFSPRCRTLKYCSAAGHLLHIAE